MTLLAPAPAATVDPAAARDRAARYRAESAHAARLAERHSLAIISGEVPNADRRAALDALKLYNHQAQTLADAAAVEEFRAAATEADRPWATPRRAPWAGF